jgi:archaellum component FlaG (FlaF/FlaG flagellin family)
MATPKLSIGAIIALAAAGIFLTLVTAGVVVTQSVPSNGTITAVNVGVYSNSLCTQNLTSISWGTVSPGSTATITCYVKNTGNVPITLTMNTASWLPSNANSYLTLTWNRQDTVLNAGQSVSATLTLTVASSTGSLTDFSFNTIITGTE